MEMYVPVFTDGFHRDSPHRLMMIFLPRYSVLPMEPMVLMKGASMKILRSSVLRLSDGCPRCSAEERSRAEADTSGSERVCLDVIRCPECCPFA